MVGVMLSQILSSLGLECSRALVFDDNIFIYSNCETDVEKLGEEYGFRAERPVLIHENPGGFKVFRVSPRDGKLPTSSIIELGVEDVSKGERVITREGYIVKEGRDLVFPSFRLTLERTVVKRNIHTNSGGKVYVMTVEGRFSFREASLLKYAVVLKWLPNAVIVVDDTSRPELEDVAEELMSFVVGLPASVPVFHVGESSITAKDLIGRMIDADIHIDGSLTVRSIPVELAHGDNIVYLFLQGLRPKDTSTPYVMSIDVEEGLLRQTLDKPPFVARRELIEVL